MARHLSPAASFVSFALLAFGAVDEKVLTNTIGMKLVLVPAGSFRMGSDSGSYAKPVKTKRITKPFYLGVYEVTQAEYLKVVGSNPSYFSAGGGGKSKVAGLDTSRFPVEQVDWLDAVTFCNTLSTREGLTPYYRIDGESVTMIGGNGYRVPTEAEWEYACRAGKSTTYTFGDDEARLGDFGWFDGNAGGRTHPVGEKSANAFGLHDVHGNVWEWCWDFYDDGYYAKSPPDDPRNDTRAPVRVRRGGDWGYSAGIASSAFRGWGSPGVRRNGVGFRVARAQSVR